MLLRIIDQNLAVQIRVMPTLSELWVQYESFSLTLMVQMWDVKILDFVSLYV